MRSQLVLTQAKHLPGVLMGDIDSLSRAKPTTSLPVELSVSSDVQNDPNINALFIACDPTVSRSVDAHKSIFVDVMRRIDMILR